MLLLVALLLLPLNAFAHDLKSEAGQKPAVCQMAPTDGFSDLPQDRSDHCPDNTADNSCESEECCPDSTEPPPCSGLRVNISATELFHPGRYVHIPEVYLTIFVPPQSCS